MVIKEQSPWSLRTRRNEKLVNAAYVLFAFAGAGLLTLLAIFADDSKMVSAGTMEVPTFSVYLWFAGAIVVAALFGLILRICGGEPET